MKILSNELISVVKRFNVTVEIKEKEYDFIYEQYVDENTGGEGTELLNIFDEVGNTVDFDEIVEDDMTIEEYFYEKILPELN